MSSLVPAWVRPNNTVEAFATCFCVVVAVLQVSTSLESIHEMLTLCSLMNEWTAWGLAFIDDTTLSMSELISPLITQLVTEDESTSKLLSIGTCWMLALLQQKYCPIIAQYGVRGTQVFMQCLQCITLGVEVLALPSTLYGVWSSVSSGMLQIPFGTLQDAACATPVRNLQAQLSNCEMGHKYLRNDLKVCGMTADKTESQLHNCTTSLGGFASSEKLCSDAMQRFADFFENVTADHQGCNSALDQVTSELDENREDLHLCTLEKDTVLDSLSSTNTSYQVCIKEFEKIQSDLQTCHSNYNLALATNSQSSDNAAQPSQNTDHVEPTEVPRETRAQSVLEYIGLGFLICMSALSKRAH